MSETVSPVINTDELLDLRKSTSLVLIDTSNSARARENYEGLHLQGALFIDVNAQLSAVKEDPKNGGRHPLPTTENFCKTLGKLGVHPKSHIVIYDSNSGANAAARLWWMLRSIGHEKVQVLNGGFQEAQRLNFPLSTGSELRRKEEQYPTREWKIPMVDINEVYAATLNKSQRIIDVREEGRYNGEYEPIDAVAGHIPGAINIPFKLNLDEKGCFLPTQELSTFYADRLKGIETDQCIIHCGSGVTACHTILTMVYAGFSFPSLYVGSWSEWSRSGNEIV